MEPTAVAPHDMVLPRWPVFLRYGHHDEVCLGDVYADTAPEMLVALAGLLREMAEHLEDRAQSR